MSQCVKGQIDQEIQTLTMSSGHLSTADMVTRNVCLDSKSHTSDENKTRNATMGKYWREKSSDLTVNALS